MQKKTFLILIHKIFKINKLNNKNKDKDKDKVKINKVT